MSLLDELRADANARKTSDTEEQALVDRASAESTARLRPRLNELYRYFREFIEHLSVIDPDIRTQCEVEAFGLITDLRQGDYRFWSRQPDDPTHFTFGFTASSRKRAQVRLAPAVADKLIADLHGRGIACSVSKTGTAGTQLVLEPAIPVLFEFSPDPARAVVVLNIRNHERVGTVRLSYAPASITQALMEELGKLVLNQENRFMSMSGGEIDEQEREGLRRRLGKERRRRQAELGGPFAKLWWMVGEGARKLTGQR